MEHLEVLVRAAGGEPCRMAALESANGLVYVANFKALDRVQSGESWPVGFPAEDVFEFDREAFSALSARWAERGSLSREEWRGFRLRQAVLH